MLFIIITRSTTLSAVTSLVFGVDPQGGGVGLQSGRNGGGERLPGGTEYPLSASSPNDIRLLCCWSNQKAV